MGGEGQAALWVGAEMLELEKVLGKKKNEKIESNCKEVEEN